MSRPIKPSILLIDEHGEATGGARRILEREGFQVLDARTHDQAMVEVGSRSPDVILLNLDGHDGLDLVRRLRQQCAIPIMLLHEPGNPALALDGLELGADDYVCRSPDWTDPLAVRELTARLRVAVRVASRMAEQRFGEVVLGEIRIDLAARRVYLCGAEVKLTRTEYELLVLMASNPGRAFEHDELLDRVWGFAHRGRHHNLRVYVNRIRKKIEVDPSVPRYLETVPGVGYRMVAPNGET